MRRFKREKKKKAMHVVCSIAGRSDELKLCVKDGHQKIKWLSLVASAKLQQQTRSRRGWNRQRETSRPVAGALMVDRIQKLNNDGEMTDLDPNASICNVLSDNDKVFLNLRDSIAVSTAQTFVRSEWAANAFSNLNKVNDADSEIK